MRRNHAAGKSFAAAGSGRVWLKPQPEELHRGCNRAGFAAVAVCLPEALENKKRFFR